MRVILTQTGSILELLDAHIIDAQNFFNSILMSVIKILLKKHLDNDNVCIHQLQNRARLMPQMALSQLALSQVALSQWSFILRGFCLRRAYGACMIHIGACESITIFYGK